MKMRVKFLLFFLLASVAILLLISVYGNTLLREREQSEKASGYEASVQQLCTSTQLVMADMDQTLFNLYTSASLAQSLRKGLAAQTDMLNVQSDLRFMCHNSPYFTAMVAVDGDGNAAFGTSLVVDAAAPMLKLVRERADELESRITLWFTENGEVYLKKIVYEVSVLSRTGTIVTRMDREQAASVLGLDSKREGCVGVLTRDGTLLMHSEGMTETLAERALAAGGAGVQPVSRSIELDGESYWLTVRADPRDGWRVLHVVRMNELLSLSTSVSQASLYACFVAAALALALGLLMTHSLTRNVKKLLDAMTDVSDGNLDVRLNIHGRDEIGKLAGRFEWMLARLRESTAQMVLRATEKQQAEYELLELKYRSLQTQISPHFICNILSSINAFAIMGKAGEVSRLSVSASQYLRDNLQGAEQKFTSLRRELVFVDEYVVLYSAVYGDCFAVKTEIPEELLDSRVPNMLLQPLVENAFVHGSPPDTDGRQEVVISAQKIGERLALRVTDHGGGISPEIIKLVREANQTHQPDRKMLGFGLRSVLQRLRLLYGDAQSMTIECEPGKLSVIVIDIPCEIYRQTDASGRK